MAKPFTYQDLLELTNKHQKIWEEFEEKITKLFNQLSIPYPVPTWFIDSPLTIDLIIDLIDNRRKLWKIRYKHISYYIN